MRVLRNGRVDIALCVPWDMQEVHETKRNACMPTLRASCC